MNLVVFTATYPYTRAAERNFVEAELPYLAEAFERIVFVPERCREASVLSDLRFEVEDGYSACLEGHAGIYTFLRGLGSSLTYRELAAKPWLLLRPFFLKRLLYFAGQAELSRSWVTAWIREQELPPSEWLFYTYWFDQASLGIGCARKAQPALRLASRAHGYDIYEKRRDPPYWPCREAALEVLDRLFVVSAAGVEYLCGKYPSHASRIQVARLGVPDPGALTAASSDGIYRIVSCSRILPVKRLGLMLSGIKAAADRRPSQRFEWRHFGKGSSDELAKQMQRLPGNLSANIVQYTSRPDLFRYYRESPVDVFLNVSADEGTPVAIMEAISCGIPVIATAVGGNGEAVEERNGILIDANPSPAQIADALLSHWDEPGQRRRGSRQVWSEKYDATRNYPDFVQQLKAIRG